VSSGGARRFGKSSRGIASALIALIALEKVDAKRANEARRDGASIAAMSIASEARQERRQGVKIARRHGKAAVAALFVTAALRVYSAGVASWQIGLLDDLQRGVAETSTLQLSDTLFQAGGVAELVMLLVTGVLFLRWLAQAVKVARDLQVSPPLAWTPSQAVWGFFIPFVNMVRPYQVLRDLHDALDPAGVPEPAPRPRLDGAAGYRKVELEKAPPPAKLPHASIGAWWALYILGGIVGRSAASNGPGALEVMSSRTMSIVSDAIEIGSASLAILVVLAISARLAERQRRLRYATDAELVSWGIDP
jgi:hypothetical protein